MAIDSCGDGKQFGKFWRRFAMFQPIRNHTQHQRLHIAHCFLPGASIGQHARQCWRLSQEAAVIFLFDINLDFHCAVLSYYARS